MIAATTTMRNVNIAAVGSGLRILPRHFKDDVSCIAATVDDLFDQCEQIAQKNCQECHRPGQIGPMALLRYDDAHAWAETIREVVQEKRMPPWTADPKHGKFSNDR